MKVFLPLNRVFPGNVGVGEDDVVQSTEDVMTEKETLVRLDSGLRCSPNAPGGGVPNDWWRLGTSAVSANLQEASAPLTLPAFVALGNKVCLLEVEVSVSSFTRPLTWLQLVAFLSILYHSCLEGDKVLLFSQVRSNLMLCTDVRISLPPSRDLFLHTSPSCPIFSPGQFDGTIIVSPYRSLCEPVHLYVGSYRGDIKVC